MKVTVKDGITGNALGVEAGGASQKCTGVSDKEVLSLYGFNGSQNQVPGYLRNHRQGHCDTWNYRPRSRS
jgi:hypothetical protein